MNTIKFDDLYGHGDNGCRFAYRMLEERPAIANISHHSLPSYEEHKQYFWSRPYPRWLAIVVTERAADRWAATRWAGTIYSTYRNEIGIAIVMDLQRRGYGRQAVRQFIEMWPPLPAEPGVRPGHYVANVAPTNAPSIALFSSLGRLVQHTYRLDAPEEKA